MLTTCVETHIPCLPEQRLLCYQIANTRFSRVGPEEPSEKYENMAR